jgi:hypothetical protein
MLPPDIKKTRDQGHQGRLAGAAGADQSHHLAPGDDQVDVSKDLAFALFIAIVETDIFDPDLPPKLFEYVSAGLFPHLVLSIHEAKNL